MTQRPTILPAGIPCPAGQAPTSCYLAGAASCQGVDMAGSTTARGYGSDHQKERARVKRDLVDKGLAHCWRCGGWIDPAMPWDLGHDDHDRTVYRGPEHRGRECAAGGNRATAGRRPSAKLKRWSL